VKTRGQKIENTSMITSGQLLHSRARCHRPRGGRPGPAGRPAASAMTFRADALRMTADFFPEYLASTGLGRPTDAPITLWDEAFLPERMRDLLREVRIPGETGERLWSSLNAPCSPRTGRPSRTGLPTGRSTSWPPAWLWAPSCRAWPPGRQPSGRAGGTGHC